MTNRNTKIITSVLFIIALAIALFVFISKRSEAPIVNEEVNVGVNGEVKSNENVPLLSDMIIIDSPKMGETITQGTLHVSGKARGSWYFEASAPFEVRGQDNELIKQSYITAQGEWMTTEFVPFKGEITFTVPDGMKSGFIVFRNDNPSGDPSRDKSVSIPVKFK
jgi:hypothetical protein